MRTKILVFLSIVLIGLCSLMASSTGNNSVLAIILKGKITEPDGSFVRDGLIVEAEIKDKQISAKGITELKAVDTNYVLTLIGIFLNEEKWPAVGDEIVLTVKDENSKILSQVSHVITSEEIENAIITLNFQISEIYYFDLNSNGKIDIFDLVIVGKNFGKLDATREQGDLNDDGMVNIFDLVTVAKHFGETLSTSP